MIGCPDGLSVRAVEPGSEGRFVNMWFRMAEAATI